MKEESEKLVQMNVMVPLALMKQLEAIAKEQARSRSSLAYLLLLQGLEAHLKSVPRKVVPK